MNPPMRRGDQSVTETCKCSAGHADWGMLTGRHPAPRSTTQVNFEPDSAFRKEKDQAKAKPKGEKKAKKPSAKTQKIAAATKAKRAAKKKIAE